MGIGSLFQKAKDKYLEPFLGYATGGTGALFSGALRAYGNHQATKAHHNAQQMDLVQLRNEANRAGFNPLTVLRSTGGQGFQRGYAGGLSSANFFSALGNGITNYTDGAYQQKARDLEIMTNSKAYQLMGIDDDPYAGYGDTIPIQIGKNTRQMNKAVAERLRILPNTPLTAQELEDLFGDNWADVILTSHLDIADSVIQDGINAASNVKQKTGNGFLDAFLSISNELGMPYSTAYTTAYNLADDATNFFKDKVKSPPVLSDKAKNARVPFMKNVTGFFNQSIRGLTTNARKIQDEINGFIRSDY